MTLFIPGTPLTTAPYRTVHDPFKTASGVQNSGPWDPWLLVVETSRLFASARCAPYALIKRVCGRCEELGGEVCWWVALEEDLQNK